MTVPSLTGTQTSDPAEVTSPQDLAKWLRIAVRGETCVYYRGHLQVARSTRNVKRRERQRAAELGSTACDAERRGWVNLVQRRHGPDDYSYIMIRTGVAGGPPNG